MYAEQEAERKKLLDERANFLKDTRNQASAEVNRAKENVAGQLDAAKKDVQGNVPELAAEIARRVLEVPAGSGPGRELR